MLNIIKSGFLIVLMSVFLVFVGYMTGGPDGAFIFFIISLAFNFFSYFFSDKIVLAAYHAQPADAQEHAWLFEALTKLANAAELPVIPKLYIIPIAEPNAFATGRNPKHAVVAVTQGLLNSLGRDEVAAVIAHEMSHIQLQHSLKAIKTSRWTAAGISATSAVVSVAQNDAELASTMNDMVGDVITDMVNNGYSKSQELDADALALTLMADAGYNPSAMLDMLAQLKNAQGSSSSGMYKTHPSPDQRIKNVNSALRKLSAADDTAQFRTERFSANRLR